MAWEVEDIETTVTELRARGVSFEEYDLPGLKTINGVAEVTGNYPSRGGQARAFFGRLHHATIWLLAQRLCRGERID